MQTATENLAKTIASELLDIDKRTAVEQMATYFAVGRKLQSVPGDARKYGMGAMKEIAGLVSELKDESRVYEIRSLSMVGKTVEDFNFEQAAIPMANRKQLTLDHWLWLMRHLPPGYDQMGQEEWLVDELAWLRRESTSAAVIEHIEKVLAEGYERERKRSEEVVQEAIGLLESL